MQLYTRSTTVVQYESYTGSATGNRYPAGYNGDMVLPARARWPAQPVLRPSARGWSGRLYLERIGFCDIHLGRNSKGSPA